LDFHKYLKKCREKNRLTQDELVSELFTYDKENFENLDAVTLSRWERNSTRPNIHKQLSLMQYFQSLSSDALPCWENYTTSEVEDLICTMGIHNIIRKNKQLVLNFPSQMMQFDDLKVYPITDVNKAHTLFELNMDLHTATNHLFSRLEFEQFIEWSQYPDNLFLACEYKEGFVGLFFSVKLKQNVFDRLLNFEMKKSDIREEDFASDSEKGSDFLLSFFALNDKIASMLFVRHYAYLIAHQKSISEIGIITALPEVKKTVENMNLSLYKSKKLDETYELEAYREKLGKVLATEYIAKMLFSE